MTEAAISDLWRCVVINLVGKYHNLLYLPKAELIDQLSTSSLHTLIGKSCRHLGGGIVESGFVSQYLHKNLRKIIDEMIPKSKSHYSTFYWGELSQVIKLLSSDQELDSHSAKWAVMSGNAGVLRILLNRYPDWKTHSLMDHVALYGDQEMDEMMTDIYPTLSTWMAYSKRDKRHGFLRCKDSLVITQEIFYECCTNSLASLAWEEMVKYDIYQDVEKTTRLLILHKHYDLAIKISPHLPIQVVYSAILTGEIPYLEKVVNYFQGEFSDHHQTHPVHCDQILDIPSADGGSASILEFVRYRITQGIRNSHVINYCVQSGSIEMVDYCFYLGYGVTISNLITAILQSSFEMVVKITNLLHTNCQQFPSSLHILGDPGIVFADKERKMGFLYPYLAWEDDGKTLDNYRTLTTLWKIFLKNSAHDRWLCEDFLLGVSEQLEERKNGREAQMIGFVRRMASLGDYRHLTYSCDRERENCEKIMHYHQMRLRS